jgi:hypothetical protein
MYRRFAISYMIENNLLVLADGARLPNVCVPDPCLLTCVKLPKRNQIDDLSEDLYPANPPLTNTISFFQPIARPKALPFRNSARSLKGLKDTRRLSTTSTRQTSRSTLIVVSEGNEKEMKGRL